MRNKKLQMDRAIEAHARATMFAVAPSFDEELRANAERYVHLYEEEQEEERSQGSRLAEGFNLLQGSEA